MNRCCTLPGNAKIVPSQKPGVVWRVVCLYCGLNLHEQKEDV